MAGRFDGRVALVTGAGRGIGAAVVRRLASEGAACLVADLDEDAASGTVKEVEDGGGRAAWVACDVADSKQVERAVHMALERFERLDILVNNAGVTRDNLLYKMSDEDWDMVLTVHLKGAFLCSRAASKPMVEQRFGKIVNLSSNSAGGNRGQVNYSAAKAGMLGLTKTLAIELGPFNINVNAIAPGYIDTEMTRATARRIGMEPEEMAKARAEQTPLRRVGQPEDIAGVAAFLCSEDSSFMTGQTLSVRGAPGPFN